MAPPAQEGRSVSPRSGRAFLTLPEEQRAALHLVTLEGMAYADAAAVLGIPIGTLMSPSAAAGRRCGPSRRARGPTRGPVRQGPADPDENGRGPRRRCGSSCRTPQRRAVWPLRRAVVQV